MIACGDGAWLMLATVLIGLGGAIGSVARYWIAVWMMPASRWLPWGTVLINVCGSFAISFFGTLTLAHGRFPAPEPARLFFMVGICGGFTTFSSFSLQSFDLARAGAVGRAALNVAGSVLLCLTAVAAGHAAAWLCNGHAAAVAQTAIEEEAG